MVDKPARDRRRRAGKRPPRILQIYRDFVTLGSEGAFRQVEEDAARACAELDCPNVHLAMESLTGPSEVWWLTPYESAADKQRVADGYARNAALMAALERIGARKVGTVGAPVDVFADYRAELSRGPWKVAGTRFFVITMTKGDSPIDGAVFEAADGTRLTFSAFGTRQEAEHIAAESGPDARLFAVRPYWGMPARAWIAADPEFWKPNPTAGSSR